MKILFTGMGSHHCKKPSNTSFFSTLGVIAESFAEITWASPSLKWSKSDLDSYDLIIFGLLPPTSLSANKLYGALHVLGLMFESAKLRIVLDSPQIWQYKNSIKAATRDPGVLFGSYYSSKESYTAAQGHRASIEAGIASLSKEVWPDVIYPHTPWLSTYDVADSVPVVPASSLRSFSVDSLLLDIAAAKLGRRDVWAVENHKSPWVTSVSKTISFPVTPTRPSKKSDDFYALGVMETSMGLILPPQDRTNLVWWNYRTIQALNSSTPIATRWDAVAEFSSNWSVLPYQVEDMSPAGRQALAARQRHDYLSAVPTREEVFHNFSEILIDSTRGEN